MLRSKELDKLKKESDWDVIVIGGGASGLGAALDATTRGYQTLCLESHDFAKGTSSRSTKLVHGGVRYLAQGDVSLVKEALRERGLLAQNAAHLVKNQSFVIPNYTWWGGPYYRFGLGMYDLLAAGLSLGKTKHISKEETIEALPTIEPTDLHSGVVYKDGQFDDSRLAVNLAQTIVDKGGTIVNYCKVIDLLKENGKITGVKAEDVLSGETYELKAKTVINATGVFSNDILQMDKKTDRKFIVPSQGIHLVFDRSFLPSKKALMIPKTSDGRVLFAVPWHDKIVIGTTDTLREEASFEPKPLEEEVQFVLETARRFLTKKPSREDVLSVFAGLRPLAAPEEEGKSTKEVSRSHKVFVSDTGLITITGGKWTTYRQMAEDVIDKAIEEKQLVERICVTTHMSIHGNVPKDKVDRANHMHIYGSDIPLIEFMIKENPEFDTKLHPDYDYKVAEVVWAVREEMAMKIEDVLARRVRLLFLDARAAMDVAQKTAKIMAKELGKDDAWVEKETAEFLELASHYLLVDYTPKNIQ